MRDDESTQFHARLMDERVFLASVRRRSVVVPSPKCIHGNPWRTCAECGR